MNLDILVLSEEHRDEIFAVINAAAAKYAGVIPEESDTEPYMPMSEFQQEMAEMQFYGAIGDRLVAVIGIQERSDVTLIRHLYVRPEHQRQGIGTRLLEMGMAVAEADTVLVGTWQAAEWAIRFYEQHGYENLGTDADLLSTYWDIPDHQIAASVVLRSTT